MNQLRREFGAAMVRRQRAALRLQAWCRVVVIGPSQSHAEAQRMAAASRREQRDSAARLLQAALRKRWSGRKVATKRHRAHAPRRTRRAADAYGMGFVSSFGAKPSLHGVETRLDMYGSSETYGSSDTSGSNETLARRRAEVSALEHQLHHTRLEVRKMVAVAC